MILAGLLADFFWTLQEKINLECFATYRKRLCEKGQRNRSES